ncbi:hypothetical protein BY458DRAFT_561271 [Sporodiniella umbellata]|nr:hypothetical protein BY458DRAFT_561271 [Sporodiniella umbellata]
MEKSINSETGMVNLLVDKYCPDSIGKVISVIYGIIFKENDIPELPLHLSYIKELFDFRLIFELESLIIRKIYTLNAGSNKKIKSKTNYNFEILDDFLHKIQGTEDIKSSLIIVTSSNLRKFIEKIQESYPNLYNLGEINYKDIKLYNRNIFENVNDIISIYLLDLRGPNKDELTELNLEIDITDFHNIIY